MKAFEDTKAAYHEAVKRLTGLSPELARGFPDLTNAKLVPRKKDELSETALQSGEIRKRVSSQPKRHRGFGSIYQPRWRDRKTGETKESPTLWISYFHRGRLHRESSHSTNRNDAVRLLKKRHAEIAAGKPVGPDIDKTTFEDMAAMLIIDYKANGRWSVARVEDAINHLREFFGDSRAVEITGDRVPHYVTARQAEKAANSTINAELAALGRMFTLGKRAGKIGDKPYIGKLALNNSRKGFFEFDQFQAVLAHLPDDIKPVIETAYETG